MVTGFVIPLAGASAICALASVSPLRLDHRALQDTLGLQEVGLASGVPFLFLSADNTVQSARTANFGLRLLAFPSGAVWWATLKEQSDGVWSSGFVAVDAAGIPYRTAGGAAGSWQWQIAPGAMEEARQALSRAQVVYDSVRTRALFEQRWPFLKTATATTVLAAAPAGSRTGAGRRPASELRLVRVFRLAALIGVTTTLALVLLLTTRPDGSTAWLIASGSLIGAVGLVSFSTYVVQWIAPLAVRWTPVLLWLLLLLLGGWLTYRKNDFSIHFALPEGPRESAILAYALAAYAALFLIRLDFDGDFFTNWLPQARFHYLLGRHDPAAIIGYGSMQAASYPPGYGVLLATLMWAADLPRVTSFLPGLDTAFTILVYRLVIFTVNAALLVLLATYLGRLRPGTSGNAIAAIAVTLLLIPSTRGKHSGAETILVPVLATAIVLIAAGRNLGRPALTTIGLAIGGMGTLMKWEAGVLLAFGVLPWLVSTTALTPRTTTATIATWCAVLVLSLVPTVVWKMHLDVRNEFFHPITWSAFHDGLPLFARLAFRALQLVLANGTFALLAIALPCAVAFRIGANEGWRAVAVPAGILALFVGWVAIFLFSNLEPMTYMENAYERLVMVPTFGAILYTAETLTRASAPQRA